MNMQMQDGRNLGSLISYQRDATLAEITLLRGQLKLMGERITSLEEFLEVCDAAEAALGGSVQQYSFGLNRRDVRTEVIEVLSNAPGGLTASEVRKRVLKAFPFVHPKTPSMTLSRLKQAGLVEQSGSVWRLLSGGAASVGNSSDA